MKMDRWEGNSNMMSFVMARIEHEQRGVEPEGEEDVLTRQQECEDGDDHDDHQTMTMRNIRG